MKKLIFVVLALCLILTGCADAEVSSAPPEWPVTVGNFITVDGPDYLSPMENADILAADGMYYATWSMGEGKPFTNGDGDEAEIFDAQVYLLLNEKTSPENAQASLDELMEMARSRYQIDSTATETYGGQKYTILTFRYDAEDNPYSQGAAAFGARGNYAINVEVSSQEGGEDPLTVLGDFLAHIAYND